MPGKIILLNGASSSGKTSLLKAFQDLSPEPFLDLGIDRFIFGMPERYLERPLWDDVLGKADRAGETGQRLISAMHRSILGAASQGMNVVADHVLVEPSWLDECVQLFQDLPAWLVGVRCPLDVLEEREKSRKNRTLGQARLQFEIVHRPGIYDLEVDTSQSSPEACARKILECVQAGKPGAFRRLRQRISELSPDTPGFPIERDASLTGEQIESFREAVGWDRMAGCYDHILAHTYAHFSIQTSGRLVAFVNVLSDGLADAFLVDLMVDPAFQGHGLGQALVRHATEALKADGIRCIELICEPRLEAFYRRCGFTILSSGIIDTWS
jgi:chloramphenicol 3-O phosphotransferase